MHQKHVRIFYLMTLVFTAVGMVCLFSGCDVMKNTSLQNTIKEELRQHRDVQYEKLTINVLDGVVTISGELYTREEIDKVVEIVEGIEGVVQVKNLMTLPDDFQSSNPTFLYY